MWRICGLIGGKKERQGANSNLKSISKWLTVVLCPLNEWWLLAAHYLAITASLNWHLVPNWCRRQSDTKTHQGWTEGNSTAGWLHPDLVFTLRQREPGMSVQANTGPGSDMYRPVSFHCLSNMDHSYLTSLLVSRGVYLSCPPFIPNTPRELWSLHNTSFILFSRELEDEALEKWQRCPKQPIPSDCHR